MLQKEAESAKREAGIREREAALIAKPKETLEEQVAEKLKLERGKIVAEEARESQAGPFATISNRNLKIYLRFKDILKTKDEKLAEAQKAQADLTSQTT